MTRGVVARCGAAVAVTAVALCMATPVAVADAMVAPQIIDFGSHQQGERSPSSVAELVNTGRSSFYVHRGMVNSGPDNAHFVVTKDECTGTTLEPGGRCAVELAFQPIDLGFTTQTFGFDVTGGDYRTLGERAAVVTLNGTATIGGAPKARAPAPPAAPVPIGMLFPVAGVGAMGLGMLILGCTKRPRAA